MKIVIRLSIAVILISVFSSSLTAGVYVENIEKDFSGMSGGQEMTSKIFIEKDRVRMEIPVMMGKMVVMIFRADKNLFWNIDTGNNTYYEMTEADLKKMKAQVDRMMEMMKEQMKNMPSDHKEMMEKMMGDKMDMGEGTKPVYTKKESGIKIGSWNTTHYIGTENGEKTEEVWACELEDIGIDIEELDALNKMGEFFAAMGSDEDFMEIKTKKDVKPGEFSGVPIKEIQFSDGKKMSETLVRKIEKRSFDSSLFELPSGVKKMENPMTQQQGMMPGQNDW